MRNNDVVLAASTRIRLASVHLIFFQIEMDASGVIPALCGRCRCNGVDFINSRL